MGVNARRTAYCDADGLAERAAALRNKCLNLAKTCRSSSGSASERTSQSQQLMSAFGMRNGRAPSNRRCPVFGVKLTLRLRASGRFAYMICSFPINETLKETFGAHTAPCLSFPAGRHDDQVDAIGLVGQLLDTMVRPAKPKQVVRPVPDRSGQA